MVVAGARAIASGLYEPTGLLTATPLFEDLDLPPIEGFVFGGHDLREVSAWDCLEEAAGQTGALDLEVLKRIRPALRRFDREVRPGTSCNGGKAIDALAEAGVREDGRSLRRLVRDLERDLRSFKERHRLKRLVVVNLCSTEPPLRMGPAQRSLEALEKALDGDRRRTVRPTTLYAYAAAKAGCPFIHFTPSNATLSPAVRRLFDDRGLPYAGMDGKTGETLVKSALAPMFKYRNLKVLSWQGYNLLGDRDGEVLAEEENRRSKIETKEGLLHSILGYPLHSHVGIDFVPSLGDRKTAWDFIHFAGFLGHRMRMQFIWEGCDSILAAPLVLDLVRLLDLAASRGEPGPARHLACFFKKPLGWDECDLHAQWHALEDYCLSLRNRVS